MQTPNQKNYQTPTKFKNKTENPEALRIIITPSKYQKQDLYEQVLGESLSHSQPFFSEEKYQNFDQYVTSHYQSSSYSSDESSFIETPQEKIFQHARKVTQLLIQLNEDQNPYLQKASKKGCNCDKSKCKQNYCICHKNGNICSSECECIECENTIITSQHKKNQKRASQLLTNILSKGCNCKNSNCIKKYCICHSNGLKCSKLCRCVECCNMEVADDQKNKQNYIKGQTTRKLIKMDQFQFLENKHNIIVNE